VINACTVVDRAQWTVTDPVGTGQGSDSGLSVTVMRMRHLKVAPELHYVAVRQLCVAPSSSAVAGATLHRMNLLSAVVALGGALLFALGAALQQFEAAREVRPRLRNLARRPRWLLSSAVIFLGGGLHILALGLGPLIVVQPMGVSSLLFALPIAAALRGRKVRGDELLGAAAVAAGLLLLIWWVPRPSTTIQLTPTVVAIVLATPAVAALLIVAATRVIRSPAFRAAGLATIAGILLGATATLVRAVIASDLPWWYPLGAPLLALPALFILQRAYAAGHFGVSFASLLISDPITAVAFGALLLGEPIPAGPVAIAAAVLAACGVIVLARTSPLERAV